VPQSSSGFMGMMSGVGAAAHRGSPHKAAEMLSMSQSPTAEKVGVNLRRDSDKATLCHTRAASRQTVTRDCACCGSVPSIMFWGSFRQASIIL
jgi:hypothetical protein